MMALKYLYENMARDGCAFLRVNYRKDGQDTCRAHILCVQGVIKSRGAAKRREP